MSVSRYLGDTMADTKLQSHLERALETAENSETKYELREALQKCCVSELGATAALDH
jgi:hypothetical protein